MPSPSYFPSPPSSSARRCGDPSCTFVHGAVSNNVSSSTSTSKDGLFTNFIRGGGCSHAYCESCRDRHLTNKPFFICLVPGCKHKVTKQTLTSKTRDEKLVEEDERVRKMVLDVFNKRQVDFEKEEDYEDYLEQREAMVYSIVYGEPDAEEMTRKLEDEKKANRTAISARSNATYGEAYESLRACEKEEEDQKIKKNLWGVHEREIKRLRKRYKKEAMAVEMGEKEKICDELLEAKRVGFHETVLKNFSKLKPNREDATSLSLDSSFRNFQISLNQNTVLARFPVDPEDGQLRLKPNDLLYKMTTQERKARVLAGGGIRKGDEVDRSQLSREFWGGF